MIPTFLIEFMRNALFCLGLCMFCIVPELWADKCGTFGNRYDASIKAIKKGERILKPNLPFSYVSNKKHFRIHFTLSGVDAVDSIDRNRNGNPDYVDETAEAFEYAYSIQVDSMGFPPPPNNGENGKEPYDVYLIDLSKGGYYGFTTSELALPGSTNQHQYSLTFIQLDNNYSISDKTVNGNLSFNTFGLDALKITAAHEFQHAIHLANYGMNDQLYDVSLYEMFCTWIESYHYPEIKDYHYYVRNYFLQPKENRFGQRYSNNVASGYANALFFEYLHDKTQEQSLGFKPILDMWENIGRKNLPYRALELSLANNNLPLHELWCGYMDRTYFTGKRARDIDSSLLFKDAHLFPVMKSDTITTNPRALFTGYVFPYEIRSLSSGLISDRLLTDTANIVISPVYVDFFRVFGGQSVSYSVIIDKNSDKNPIGFSNYYADINLNSTGFCSLIKLSEGEMLLSASRPYPNPLSLKKHSKMQFPLPDAIKLGEEVEIKIFTVAGAPVYSERVKVGIDYTNTSFSGANILVATLENPGVLSPGIYIFTIYSGFEPISGKFIVKQ
jgi:hypothetical protein